MHHHYHRHGDSHRGHGRRGHTHPPYWRHEGRGPGLDDSAAFGAGRAPAYSQPPGASSLDAVCIRFGGTADCLGACRTCAARGA